MFLLPANERTKMINLADAITSSFDRDQNGQARIELAGVAMRAFRSFKRALERLPEADGESVPIKCAHCSATAAVDQFFCCGCIALIQPGLAKLEPQTEEEERAEPRRVEPDGSDPRPLAREAGGVGLGDGDEAAARR